MEPRGKAELQSGSGDVKLSRVTGEIRLQTGRATCGREIAGRCGAAPAAAILNWKKLERAISICIPARATLRLAAFMGHFMPRRAAATLRPRAQAGAWEIRTGSGNVHVRLPASAAFDAESFHQFGHDGGRSCDHDDGAGARAGDAQEDRRQSARRRACADVRTGPRAIFTS
jgi:hypothetical protein